MKGSVPELKVCMDSFLMGIFWTLESSNTRGVNILSVGEISKTSYETYETCHSITFYFIKIKTDFLELPITQLEVQFTKYDLIKCRSC